LDLKYGLCILNSKLIGWLHNKVSPKANKGLFPKILINDVRNIPLVEVSQEAQQPFIEFADKMLSFNSELQNKRQRFLRRLSDNFTTDNNKGINPLVTCPLVITGTLARFDELDFKQFIVELKKQKINLSLKEQVEWEVFFNDYKQECCDLVRQINETDREIDEIVYELYELTEEEIGIIDNSK
jgi:hypothetical protein